jgi:hypothetical protein
VIGSRQFDSNSSGIFQIPRIVELRNSIPHFPLGMEMEPTSTKITFRQHVKVPTYSINQGLSKNAIKKVVIPIGSKDMVFAKSL